MVFYTDNLDLMRAEFPALSRTFNGHPIAFFDGPGGTQVPQAVMRAISTSYIERNANFDGAFSTSIDNTQATWAVRECVANFLGAESAHTISFGANMTSLNYALARAIGRTLTRGDEILITALDHEANRGPWLSLTEFGVVIKEVAMLENGELDYADLGYKLNDKTRVLAVGLASNALGTVNDIQRIRQLANPHELLIVADAVHYAAHFSVDVAALGVDCLLCSAYKFYGPHVGILYTKPGLLDRLRPDHLSTQKDIAPYRIETGTLNYPAIAGVQAAIEFIASHGEGSTLRQQIKNAIKTIHHHEMNLARQYYDGLSSLKGIKIWGPPMSTIPRTPTISITMPDITPEQIATRLGENALQVWHGHFYAQRVLDTLGLADRGGLLRVGMSMYNSEREVDRLLTGLEDISRR